MLLPGRGSRVLRRHVRQAMRRARQTSERNSRSVYFLGVFLVLVVFMLLAEVVYVDPYTTVTTYGGQSKDSSWLYNIVPSLGNNFERIEEVHLEMDDNESQKLDRLYQAAKVDHWQRIANTADKFFVFSAFMDRRRNVIKYVRVIAAARTRLADRVKQFASKKEEKRNKKRKRKGGGGGGGESIMADRFPTRERILQVEEVSMSSRPEPATRRLFKSFLNEDERLSQHLRQNVALGGAARRASGFGESPERRRSEQSNDPSPPTSPSPCSLHHRDRPAQPN